MPIDVQALRAETPGVEHVRHLNNAGSALTTRRVLDAVTGHLAREAEIGGYEAQAEAAETLARFYDAAAALVGGAPAEIAFVENATRGWDMAFYAVDWKPGDRILTARSDYNSNMIAYRQVERRFGVEIVLIPNDDAGRIDVDALAAAVDGRTRLIALTDLPTNDGLINPAEAVGQVARDAGVPFLLDACQSVGQMPIDVGRIGCTMLSTTGRKYLRGPRGTGFLWVREDWIDRLEPPFLDTHAARWSRIDGFTIRDDAKRFENWEQHLAGKIGLTVALEHAADLGVDAIWARIRDLSGRLRAGLSALPDVTLHDTGVDKSGIVTFTKAGETAAETRARLAARRINCSVSFSQLTRTDLTDAGIAEMVRASVHAYNTEAEIDALLETVAEAP
ncbi:MAG: aminotransferase class V-fold PLP-dependent enzyme [Alphaproteobacteria bacterium]|nr:aminotransferase class V-fold PLP-dependent enzyme [Alphaproteobacteria bacterium]